MSSIRQIGNRYALEFSRRTTCGFLAAVNRVAKHFRHNRPSTKKVDLEPVRLLLGTRLGVDAFDVGFGIRIWSFSHKSSDGEVVYVRRIMESRNQTFPSC